MPIGQVGRATGGGGTGGSGFSGYSGYSGVSGDPGGTSGYSGFTGRSGFSGFSGANPGASGYSGYSGISGYSGFSSSSGFSGFSGASGSGGAGDITGPVSSTDNAIALWEGIAGDELQDSPVIVGPVTGNILTPGSLTTGFGGSAAGDIALTGTSSGTVHITAPAVAGTGTFNPPVTGSTTHTLADIDSAQTFSGKKYALSAALAVDDTYEGTTIIGLNAGATIAQWEAVYLGGSSTWLVADANGSGTYPARGLATAAYTNTNPATILVQGVARNDAFNFTPGGALYLSASVGAITQTPPAASGDKVQQIGYALTADIIYVDFNSTFLTVT